VNDKMWRVVHVHNLETLIQNSSCDICVNAS